MIKLDNKEYPGNLIVGIIGWHDEVPDEIYAITEYFLSRIPQRERDVVKYKYKDHLTNEEIGKIINVCGQRARQIYHRAMRRLRENQFIKTMIENGIQNTIEITCQREVSKALMIQQSEFIKTLELFEELDISKERQKLIITNITIFSISLSDTSLSVRAFNALDRQSVKTIGDLVRLIIRDKLADVRNIGEYTVIEILLFIKKMGIVLEV